tara:strand:+ start:14709 stop:15290 length:582 start_codon:yes stop_codon:yes gene_type:complete
MGKILKDSTAKDLITTIQAVKDTNLGGAFGGPRAGVGFIMLKLTAEIAGDNDLWNSKEVQYNTTTNVWDDITSGRTTDSDLPVLVEGGGSADDVVRAFPSRDTDGDPLYVAARGGGSTMVYLEITADTNISTYTATIYNNPIDRTSIEVGVTVRALQHDAGTIPDSGAGQGFWATYDSDNDVYHITNYSIFYG